MGLISILNKNQMIFIKDINMYKIKNKSEELFMKQQKDNKEN